MFTNRRRSASPPPVVADPETEQKESRRALYDAIQAASHDDILLALARTLPLSSRPLKSGKVKVTIVLDMRPPKPTPEPRRREPKLWVNPKWKLT